MSKLYIFILPILLLLVLTSCSSYLDVVDIDKTKIKYMEATQKGEIYSALKTVAIITATYMNRAEPQKFNRDITLLMGVYYPTISNPEENSDIDAEHLNVYISSNGVNYQVSSFKALKPDDPLLSHMPLFNSWNDYYLLEFKDVNSSYFDFVIEDRRYGKIVLPFVR